METTNLNACQIKPYTAKELTELYGITKPTFLAWIRPIKEKIGQRHGRYYTVKQVETIFGSIGFPKSIAIEPKDF